MWSGPTSCARSRRAWPSRDVQHVGADALDRRAHLDQHPRQVLDVRLAGGVADDVVPGVSAAAMSAFSVRHDRRLVHEELARCRPFAAGRAMLRPCSIVAPSARKASRCGSSRRRPMTSPPGGGMSARAEAGQQRPGEQERGADALGRGRGVDGRWRSRASAQRRPRCRRALRRCAPRSASRPSIASTSRMCGTLRRRPPPRSAARRRAAAGRRSCCRRARRCRTAARRLR